MNNRKIVILGNGTEWLKYSLNDIKKRDDVIFINDLFPCKNKFLKTIIRLHYSKRIHLPFKNVWNRYLKKSIFNCLGEYDELVFVFYDWNRLATNKSFLRMLKKIPKITMVYVFTNIIEVTYANLVHFVDDLKTYYDLVFAFDEKDAKKYNFILNPLTYSYIDLENKSNSNNNCVFFAGSAKDRLDDLIKSYDRLSDLGIRCNYHIINVPEEKIVPRNGITYNVPIPYEEVVKETIDSSCIIEFKQGGSSALTIKVCEAVFYDKLLISTNPAIKCLPFYDENYMFVIEKPEDIEPYFFKNYKKVKYSKKARDYFFLYGFIERIFKYLYGGY